MKTLWTEAAGYFARNRHHRIWQRVVGALACMVVFCTTYALILPAVTMESTTGPCGLEAHAHSGACYGVTEDSYHCDLELHQHTDQCRDEDDNLICGYADFVIHRHDEFCYDQNERLVCSLEEKTLEELTEEELRALLQPNREESGEAGDPGELEPDDPALGMETEPEGSSPSALDFLFSADRVDGEATKEAIEEADLQSQEPETQEPVSQEPENLEEIQELENLLHQHDETCFDEEGNLICGRVQLLEHQHTAACLGQSVLSCELEEHSHSEACPVIGLIAALPDQQSVEAELEALAGDEAGQEEYLAELRAQVQAAYEAYAALSAEEQEKVTNLERLEALEALCSLPEEEPAAVTVINGDGTAASVAPWEGKAVKRAKARGQVQMELPSGEQGYLVQDAQYYQITGLKGDAATVTYKDGGLSAEDDAELFVFNLGPTGTTTPSSCALVGEPAKDEAGALFTYFSFAVPTDSEADSQGEGDVYAFISATPAAQTENTWTAETTDGSVRATVTLPEGATAPSGYELYIRKIENGDYYPTEETVKAEVGAINGYQCYMIRWVNQDVNDEPNWETDTLPLNQIGKDGENVTVTVKIEYLKPDARLYGPKGARKLLIFNSDEGGALVDRVSETVENVTVEGDYYNSFTFHTDQAGPYVLVSKKLETGYIEALAINSIVDGTKPFDLGDAPGNDSGDNNKIVRSYDTIQYNLGVTFAARQVEVSKPEVNMYFEMTLGKSATAARFDVSKMLWLGENYSVEYLDAQGNVIMIMAHDGKYYEPQKDKNGNAVYDGHGFAQPNMEKLVSMNAQVNGSKAGENSYKVASGSVATQRMVGCAKVIGKGGNALAGTETYSACVEVRNADHGEIFAPTFKIWLEGNEENYGPETVSANGGMQPAQPVIGNQIKADDVKVSAGTNFNLQLKKNTDMSYKNWFDFSTGQAVKEPTRTELERLANLEENHGKSNPAEFTESGVGLSDDLKETYANYRYGRITCYGITLQLYSDTDNAPEKNRASKGLKGMSLPVGDITFDLNFRSESCTKQGEESDAPSVPFQSDEYPAILWDYNENIPANTAYSYTYKDPGRGKVTTPSDGKGNGGRNLYWDGESRSPYAKGAAPSNYIKYHEGCYYGGDWALVNENGQKITDIGDVANPTKVTGTGANTTYHFKVSDYDFDFDEQHFPLQDAGNSGKVPGYDTYARCFSAGCVQVLSVFPRVQEIAEAEIFLHTTVSNLHLTTRAGQELKAADNDDSKINHEVNKGDNKKDDQIVLYAPGNLTKGSAFNGKYKDDKGNEFIPAATNTGFLGTEYWTTSYDCSTFAGDNIWIMSYGMISAGSDYRMRSMNLLQLFDSRALSVRGTPDVVKNYDTEYDEPGKETFLYAADPDYRDGYDTNEDGVLAYMNSVREEDLVYSADMPDGNGNITVNGQQMKCIGVLMELRGCDLLGGKYQYMRIPVKVNGDEKELVGKTVATVNTFRVWSWDLDDISWANSHWNDSTGKNELNKSPEAPKGDPKEIYSGECANGENPPNYIKTEYADGHQKTGTHAGGTLAGNSLLILGYKAHVGIDVIGKGNGESGTIAYDIANGETVVDYRLKNIRTEISDLTSQTERPLTTLTIRAALDEGHSGAQRISISGGSYRIMGYAVGADGTASEKKELSISEDPLNPTVLEYEAPEDQNKRYRIRVYVQAKDRQSVTFVIQNAPVGLQLPDITFQANLADEKALTNNDTITTAAYISGEGDNRAYDQAKGNTANTTIGVVVLGGTKLHKTVTEQCIELNGEINYEVIYNNSGTEPIGKLYLYDLLPYQEDGRGSQFTGNVKLENIQIETEAKYTVYYSTTSPKKLYPQVKNFSDKDASAVERMLQDETIFHSWDPKDEKRKDATCLYLKVEGLGKNQDIKLKIKMKTEDNKAGDWYKNDAHSWIPANGTVSQIASRAANGTVSQTGSQTVPLTAPRVETQTVSRSISGVVWYDKNLNGIRDDGEPLLKNVTATLFKKNKNGSYEVCTKDVTCDPNATEGNISPVTTKSDGTYSFEKLAAGDYIVAFSGGDLKDYTGATTYQQSEVDPSKNNDGKAISELKATGINSAEYPYYICYSIDSESMPLHSLEEMKAGKATLTNGVESYVNQDLGLIIATPELPETGGSGVASYMMGGLLLMAMSAASLRFRRKR